MALDLHVFQDGKGQSLMEWIREKGEIIYNDIGKKTWRVPPVKFNVQKLSEQKFPKTNEGQNFRIDCPVLGQLNVTDQENNRAENIVCGAFESLSSHIVEKGRGTAMFLISNFEYDNYLNKLSRFVTEASSPDVMKEPTDNIIMGTGNSTSVSQSSVPACNLPKDVTNRGELDILILHQQAGVVIVQTKAVGYNFFDKSSQFERSSSIQTAIEKACSQLFRDRKVLLHIMKDLGLETDQILAVVALPNLSRNVLVQEMSPDLRNKICNEYKLSIDNNFLCAEDFIPDISGCYGALERKWNDSLLPLAKGMDLTMMQQIAYRTVGLLSTVSVWSYAQPRIEVRNWNDAAWETGNRYTQVVLSPNQVELLKREDQYLYLWGPAGSGKTLLLSLKGRQWLRRGCNVAVLNTRLGSRGRTVGQVIENTINRTKGLKKEAIRVDLDLSESEDVLTSILCEQVKDKAINFLLDEIAWVKETEKLLSLVKRLFPHSAIWCAGMLAECQPEGFETGILQVILRCPPTVQRVLRLVDNREERCELYIMDSIRTGLPTDGLPAYFIIHSEHGDASTQPYDCALCAKQLSDFLTNKLNLKGRVTDRHSTNEVTRKTTSENCVQSACRKLGLGESPDGHSFSSQLDYTDFHSLGSSKGSDSGCDVDYNSRDSFCSDTFDVMTATVPEKKEMEINDKGKDKSARKKRPKQKKPSKKNADSENLKLNVSLDSENILGVADSVNPIRTSVNTSSEIQTHDGSLSTKKSNRDKACKPDSACSSTNAKSNAEINKRSQSNATGTNCQDKNVEKPDVKDSKEDNNASATSSKRDGGKRSKPCRKTKRDSNNNGIPDASTDNSAEYPRLNFSDAVLPVTVPRGWHHYNKRGNWSITREALAQEMILLGSSRFSQTLYDSGVPVKVEEQMVMNAEEKRMENHFVICPLGAVHGLEYKLVVCVPSACDLPEYIQISEGIRNGHMEPKVLMKRTQFGENYLKRKEELEKEEHTSYLADGKTGPRIDKVRISTHVAEQGAPYDLLYESATEDDIRLFQKKKLIHSETRNDSPTPYKAPRYTDEEIKKIKEELCGKCDTDKCVCKYFNPQELAAVQRLSAWNKAYVLMCASRCTSMLVLVLP